MRIGVGYLGWRHEPICLSQPVQGLVPADVEMEIEVVAVFLPRFQLEEPGT